MTTVFLGSGEFSRDLLESLPGAGFDIAGVITRPDRPAGRYLRPSPTPVKTFAVENGLRVYEPEGPRDPAFLSILEELRPSLLLVADYGHILTPEILAYPTSGCVNVHPSLLPLYRGAAPIQRALMDGARTTGVTLMVMDEGMDTGGIIAQEAIPVEETEDALALRAKLASLGTRLLVEYIPSYLSGSISPRPQEEDRATCAPPITKEDLVIDWTREARAIDAQVRALSPRPGAYTFFRGKRLKILRAVPTQAVPKLEPGALEAAGSGVLLVGTLGGALRLELLQPEGGKAMGPGEFLRGYRLQAEERFRVSPIP